MKNIQLLLIFFIAFNSSCIKKQCKDDELQIVKKDIAGNVLRMGGFYYKIFNGEDEISYFIPYHTGVGIIGSYGSMDFQRFYSYASSSEFGPNKKQFKTEWSVFEIQNDTLRMDYWGIAKCERPVFRGFFKILNDTTMLNFKNTSMRDMKDYFVSDTFYFQYLSPKPDSNNEFIK